MKNKYLHIKTAGSIFGFFGLMVGLNLLVKYGYESLVKAIFFIIVFFVLAILYYVVYRLYEIISESRSD